MGGKNLAAGWGTDRMRVAVEPLRRRRQIRRDERDGPSEEAAKRTLIATMAGRWVFRRNFVVVSLYAKLGRIAKQRPKLGGDRCVIGAGESGRGQSRRCRGGEKLNDQRKRDQKRSQGRAERPQAALPAPSPQRKCPAPEAHQHSLRRLIR